MKCQVYMQAPKTKKIYKQTKKQPTIRFWDETKKAVRKNSTSTTWSHRKLRRQNILPWKQVLAIMTNEINNQDTVERLSFMEKFSLKQVIKKFFRKGYEATCNEMIQIHQITCFKSIKSSDLNPGERKRAL